MTRDSDCFFTIRPLAGTYRAGVAKLALVATPAAFMTLALTVCILPGGTVCAVLNLNTRMDIGYRSFNTGVL